jgi:chromosome partitioning protein
MVGIMHIRQYSHTHGNTYMITLIANTKGGVGKTSLATSILAALAKDKGVVGVDLDSVNKAASLEWSKNRSEIDGKFYFLSGDVRDQITKIAADYDEVVIDAGGFDNTEYRQAISIADVIIIPLLVGSTSNIEGLRKVAETIEQMRPDNLPKVYGVVTKAPHHSSSPELDRAISEIINDPLVKPCPTVIGDRVWYTRAFDEGVGLLDLKPIKRNEIKYIELAKKEFSTLFDFIYGEQNV